MTLKYTITDDYNVRTIIPQTKKTLLIRCLEPSYKKNGIPYEIKYLDKFKDVLTLYFQDITEVIENKPKYIKTFEEYHVEKILKFLLKNNDFEEIVIHCNMGQSRSPAIMLGIINLIQSKKINIEVNNLDEIINEIKNQKYYNPNKLVLNVFENYCKKPIKISKKSNYFSKITTFLFLLFVSSISLYIYLNKTKGFNIYFYNYNINNEYAKYLIQINDNFIDKMVLFENIAIDGKKAEKYTEEEKEKIKNIIIAENSILTRLDKTPPKDKNTDYENIYNNMKEAYALYLQGQIMKVEYIYQTKESLTDERFTIGDSITNLTGGFIIEYDQLINKIRNTNYYMKYTVMDGLPNNLGNIETEKINKDDKGNIILDKNKNYLYLPNGEVNESVAIDKSSKDKNMENFVKDFNNLN